MSLTSQLDDKDSPARRFFTKFESKEGAKECLALLQTTKPIRLPQFAPAPFVHGFIGTTTDYLIRYAANGNRLIFKNTTAAQALASSEYIHALTGQDISHYLDALYKIGKQYLDGRDATDHKAVYSATALAMMDNVRRSGRLPQLFSEPIPKHKMEHIRNSHGKGIKEKMTNALFDEYFGILGGELYAQDIAELLEMFTMSVQSSGSELFGARFIVFNETLGNSGLIGGADFDCVIEYKKRQILTDIKTMTKPLQMEHLRQIIGYALLYDKKKDNFTLTDIGIYFSRSASFRFLPIDDVIRRSFPSFQSVDQARRVFIKEVKHT